MVPTMSESAFVKDWRSRLAKGDQGVVLVDANHPLEVYVGSSDLGHALLQIRSAAKPPLPEISELVLLTRHEHDGHWLLSLNLQDARFAEIFMRLTGHLVGASRRDTSPEAAWVTVAAVLDNWKRLLRPRPLGLLSLDGLRGLVGELWTLMNRFASSMSAGDALAGWLGPLGAPQDFWYEASGFHEAKAIGPSAPFIKVSSAEQLDQPGMELLVLHVPQVNESEPGAINLIALVDEVLAALVAESSSSAELLMRLKRLGVDLDKAFYKETWFRVATVEAFRIWSDFPAIRSSELAPGIERVRFSLDRKAIAPFLVSTEQL
jgi:Putative  PD-(D/E)XK family member, (DUF4420)